MRPRRRPFPSRILADDVDQCGEAVPVYIDPDTEITVEIDTNDDGDPPARWSDKDKSDYTGLSPSEIKRLRTDREKL